MSLTDTATKLAADMSDMAGMTGDVALLLAQQMEAHSHDPDAILALAARLRALAVPVTPPVPAKATLAPEDLKFLGFVRFPQDNVGDLWYANGVLGMRTVGSDLRAFIVGNVTATPADPFYEMIIPQTDPSPDLASAPLCRWVKSWGNVTEGRRQTGGSAGSYLGGLHWDAERNALWWSYGDLYVPTQSHPTIGCTIFDDKTGTFKSFGPWRTEWTSNRTRGALCPIPPAFAKSYTEGNAVGIMAAQASGNASSPFGAILSAMQLPDPTSTPADVTTNAHWTIANHGILLHDLEHRQARDTRYKTCGWKVAYDCTKGATLEPGIPFWGGSDPGACNDTMSSCVWIDLPGKHGLLYFGQLSTTPEGYHAPGDPDGFIHQGYGSATHYSSPSHLVNVCCHDQDDPFWGTTGPFSHYRVPTAWIYKPSDLIATAQGKADLWTRTPTSTFALKSRAPDLHDRYGQGMMGGSYFDPASRRLYCMLGGHDNVTVAPNARPCLMVFEVKG